MADSLLSRLRERRVFQMFGLYLGMAWGVLQFIDWLVKRYLLSSHLVDAVLLIFVSLAPAVLILAYHHGAPGRNHWTRLQKIAVPSNLAVTGILLALLFQGKDLGAASRTVTVTDESGQRLERVVPKAGARSRAAIFFFDGPVDGDLRWLRYGVPKLLADDLNQDPFVAVMTPFSGWQSSFFDRIRRAGFDNGLDLPAALKRHLAAEYSLPRFVTGEIHRDGEAFRIDLEVHAAEGAGGPPARHTVSGPEVLPLVDDLTVWLKQELGVHRGGAQLAPDLPIADRTSENVDAMKVYFDGQLALLLRNAYPEAADHLEKAVALDPSFPQAHYSLSVVQAQLGDSEGARVSVQNALRHEYKLTEILRFQTKGWKYFLDAEVDKRTALYEMWAELYPEDAQAQVTLAFAYIWAGNRIEDSIAAFRRAIEIDPGEDWALRRIADLLMAQGKFEQARDTHRRYGDLHPEDHWTAYHLGRTYLEEGRLEEAREPFEKAHLLLAGVVQPPLALAALELRLGHLDAAEARLEEAQTAAASPSQKSTVLRQRIQLLRLTGRPGEAFALLPELAENERRFRKPLDFALLRMTYASLHVEAGQDAEMQRVLDESSEQLKPPFDAFMDLGYMLFHEAQGNTEALFETQGRVDAFMKRFRRQDLLYLPTRAKARALEDQGDFEAAAEAYRESLELLDGSANDGLDDRAREETLCREAALRRQLGDTSRAEGLLEDALRSFPSLPICNVEMARLLIDTGRAAEARPHLEIARRMLERADANAQISRRLAEFE